MSDLYRVTVRLSGRPPAPYSGMHQFETHTFVEAENPEQAARYGLAAVRPHYDPQCLWEVLDVDPGEFLARAP